MKSIFTFFIICFCVIISVNAQNTTIIYKTAARNISKESALSNPIKLDPNVVKDFLKVSVDPLLGDVKKTISIYDILGREVLMQIFEGADKQLYIQNLSRGLYFIRIDTPDLAIVSKFEVSQ
ncbi:MAG: Secretion system C-terminal sorting domain [Bacteroidota bacterium]|jgi:hypothetical protein